MQICGALRFSFVIVLLCSSSLAAQETSAPEARGCAGEAICLADQPVAVHFPAQADGPILVQVGAERLEIDPRTRQVRKLESSSKPTAQQVAQTSSVGDGTLNNNANGSSLASATAAQEPVDNRGIVREAVAFDFYLVNLPTTRPVARGSLHVRFTHRFLQPTFKGTGRDLFGLDAFSFSSFGFTYGVTNRIAAIAYRSPYLKTLELGASIRLLDEGVHRSPVSAYARASVERTDNFGGHATVNLAFPISRTVTPRGEFFFEPIFSLRANPFPSPLSPEENLFGLGLGATVKIRPSVALTGEYLARLKGFQPFTRDTISFGIEKRTFRHVFQLVFSNSFGTTTSHMLQGGDLFKLGFNIRRQLR